MKKQLRKPSVAVTDLEQVFDALAGKNVGQNARHVIARRTLINALVEQPQVLAAFSTWAKTYGLVRRAVNVATGADRLSHALAIDHRSLLFMQQFSLDVSDFSPRTVEKLYALLHETEAACEQFIQALDALPPKFFRKVQRFARENLKAPWPFVVKDMIEYFVMGLCGYAFGVPYQRRSWLEPTPISVPEMTVHNPSDFPKVYA